jgi:hypothetical protein
VFIARRATEKEIATAPKRTTGFGDARRFHILFMLNKHPTNTYNGEIQHNSADAAPPEELIKRRFWYYTVPRIMEKAYHPVQRT